MRVTARCRAVAIACGLILLTAACSSQGHGVSVADSAVAHAVPETAGTASALGTAAASSTRTRTASAHRTRETARASVTPTVTTPASLTPTRTPSASSTPKPAASTTKAATAGPTATASQAGTWWHPEATGPNNGPEFQWELDHALNVQDAEDMGQGATNAAGQEASSPTLFDIDGIDNPASTVAALHSLGDKVICYIEVGSAGNYYSAAEEGISVTYYAQLQAAGDLGSKMQGYPEYYLNINAASTVSIIESMIKQQCAAKGFDAVEPDIDDSYTDATGFSITEAQNIAYDETLGNYAHSLGLAWGQKNGDNDPQFSEALEPTADFLLDEECNYYSTCGIVATPYVKAGKLVLNVEYTDDWGPNTAADLAKFCSYDESNGIDGTLFTSALAGQRNPCQ